MQILDMFAHIRGPKYSAALTKRTGEVSLMPDPVRDDLNARLESTDQQTEGYEYTSVLSTMQENIKKVEDEIYLCQVCNDEYLELMENYPKYFMGAAALLPTSDMNAAVKEAERAITKLKLTGLLVGTHVQGDLLGDEKMFELYDLAAQYDVPIWIHPFNRYHGIDYTPMDYSCETAKTMMDLTTCGVFEKHPNIKFVTHHGGGVVPLMYPRIKAMYYEAGPKMGMLPPGLEPEGESKKKARIWTLEQGEVYFENLKKFYYDTALDGIAPDAMAYRCGFFGIDRCVFSGDFPGGPTAPHSLKDSILTVEQMQVSDGDKEKIFNGNAKKLLKIG